MSKTIDELRKHHEHRIATYQSAYNQVVGNLRYHLDTFDDNYDAGDLKTAEQYLAGMKRAAEQIQRSREILFLLSELEEGTI